MEVIQMTNENQFNQWDKELEKLLKEAGLEGSPIEVIHSKLEDEFKQELNIGLFGAPGVGKSTLMNKLAGNQIADAGIKPGIEVTQYKWGENDSITFYDLPGFDGLPEEHTPETYWENFKISELDLLICMFDTKLRKNDEVFFFEKAIQEDLKVIFVRSKSDSIFDPEIDDEELRKQIKQEYINNIFGAHHKLLFVSSKTNEGIDELQNEIINNLDAFMREKYFRNAKGYSDSFLELKRKASRKTVLFYSTLSAGANLNPITGIALDLPNTIKMVRRIAKNFNLTDKRLESIEKQKKSLAQEFQIVINLITKAGTEAFKTLVAKQLGEAALKRVTSAVPFVGATIGFTTSYYFGMKTLDECFKMAKELNEMEIYKKYES